MTRRSTGFFLVLLLLSLGALSACQMLARQAPPQPSQPSQAQATGPCLVLALPGSGPYAPIGSKVSHGARLAQRELSTNGGKVHLEIINTGNHDWPNQLAALPSSCAVVGGPLQARNFAQARQAKATEQRVFFTFMPSLEDGDEGARAWRFFPSPQDQIDALIAFATDSLNIRAYGAFYPSDAYGMRMAGLLEQSLARQNMLLQKAVYNPADMSSWSAAAAPLINPVVAEGSSTPVPQTSFEALFLPDSWKNMEMLTTSLLYNGEDRLVLLGTTLWEQSLSGKQLANADKYALAVFPGAWNASRAPAALREAGTDFWVALGYDFVRFGASLGLAARPDAAEVSALAARASGMLWGMAPLSWDSAGIAHQKLFIFQATPTGMVPLNLELYQQTRTLVQQRAALRMQGLPAVDAQGNAVIPGLVPGQTALPSGQPGQPLQPGPAGQGQMAQPGPLGTTPMPSYKLRLPSRSQ